MFLGFVRPPWKKGVHYWRELCRPILPLHWFQSPFQQIADLHAGLDLAAGMLDQNDKEYFNVSGMMIYDPSIQYQVTSEVAALPFVDG